MTNTLQLTVTAVGGDRFVRGLYSPQHRHLYWFEREDVELVTNGRYLYGRHDVTA